MERRENILRFIIIVLAFVLGGASALRAQSGKFVPLPAEYDGSMMPYDFSRCDTVAAWPDSLEAVGVVYVARHGARFLSSRSKIAGLQKELYEAAKKRRISAAGEKFLALLGEVEKKTDGRWGCLSEVGLDEERRLGAAMQHRFPNLLHKARVNGVSTYVPRAMMTMYEFMHAMESHDRTMRIYTNSGTQNDTLLYFFDVFADYDAFRSDKGGWKPVYDEFVKKTVPTGPAARLTGRQLDNNKRELRALTMDIYGVLSSLRAMGLPAPTTEFMTEEEYRACYLASNLRHFLRNTPTRVSDSAVPAVTPLIERIVADGDSIAAIAADEEAHGDAPRFYGYYGHAETLLPLLSALGIEGCFAAPDNWSDLQKYWQLQNITPLGANFEITLLRGPSGTIYASLRLNGRAAGAPFVPWSHLRLNWLHHADGL